MISDDVDFSLDRTDYNLDQSLRPAKLSDFFGNNKTKSCLEVLIQASLARKEPLPHILFSGPPGLGKTSLARILSKEMSSNMVVTSGPALKKPADLVGILTSLTEGDFLFIDEIHAVGRNIEEYLYPAMEDFRFDIVVDSGPAARLLPLFVKPFTLVAATTLAGSLSSPLLTRFLHHFILDFYDASVMEQIILRNFSLFKIEITSDACTALAKMSRGVPRICNNLVRWIRDFVQVKKISQITSKVVKEASAVLSIDDRGLTQEDRKILRVIIEKYNGGPVGLNTIAVATGLDSRTIMNLYEPYLIVLGLLNRTSRGRETTPAAEKLLWSNCL